ncbi:MAG: hydrogenase maturation peptidase HycI [Lentisphaerota bacterium]
MMKSPYILMGIGNALHGDDGAGPAAAEALSDPRWLSLNCGAAPENFTSIIRKHHPGILVLVDASDMQLPPGSIRRIPHDKIQNTGLGTHQMPLFHLVRFLEDAAGEIIFIGIQPRNLGEEEGLSPEVDQAVHRLVHLLKRGDFSAIPQLGTQPEGHLDERNFPCAT